MYRLVAPAMVLAGIIALASPAMAARLADSAERPALVTLTGISDVCLDARISTEDQSWGVAKNLCADAAATLVKYDSGVPSVFASVPKVVDCPIAGVPDAPAVDIGVCRMDGVTARRLAAAELSSIYGRPWIRQAKRWLVCMTDSVDDSTGLVPGAVCEFEFKRAAGFTGGSFRLVRNDSGIEREGWKARQYSKVVRACSIASTVKFASGVQITKRELRVPSSLGCHLLKTDPSLVPAIDTLAAAKSPKRTPRRMTINVPSPNGAGFEQRTRLACTAAGAKLDYVVSCTNKLGDRFVYTFTVKPKPVPKPPASGGGSGCHPSYVGACLQQGIGDYDCAGGSGDGPNYTGPVTVVGPDEFDLDRDGDGEACEG